LGEEKHRGIVWKGGLPSNLGSGGARKPVVKIAAGGGSTRNMKNLFVDKKITRGEQVGGG